MSDEPRNRTKPSDPPIEASLQSTLDATNAISVAADSQATIIHEASSVDDAVVIDAPSACGRFQIVRSHARGGLGEVFVAQDDELRRPVALKRIQDRFVDDENSRARFVREAEITGNLEHPGIVPVYGLGADADGRPYYAMRFIQGESLKDTIAAFHGAKHDRRQWGLELRKLLRRFLDVCNAMEYAHSRGVLHRDLKPANIMVGKYGETLVVDWGLAKAIGRTEASRVPDEDTLAPGADAELTEMGTTVGTPQYMSPEQASGQTDEVTPAADIYSLGGVLYCLLTGKPPVTGTSRAEVLEKVRRGEMTPPRKIRSAAAPALESICLKAMSLAPQDRYASAKILADDVERWLGDERVDAHRETFGERAARWSRTNRTLVAAAIALVATGIVGLVVGLIAVSAEQRETDFQRRTAERKQAEAESARADAEKAQVEEAAQRKLADEQRKFADAQRDQAEWTAYLANIHAADAEWDRNQPTAAMRLLDDCNVALRGWEFEYLKSKFDRRQQTLFRQAFNVGRVVMSSDGKRLVAGVADRKLMLWNLENGVEQQSFEHGEAAIAYCFLPDGRLAISTADRTVRVWDLEKNAASFTQSVPSYPPDSLACSRDGKYLAGSGNNGVIRIWEITTGELIRTIPATRGSKQIFFSSDGEWIVNENMGMTNDVERWSIATGVAEPLKLPESTSRRSCLTLSADGMRYFGGYADGTIRIWDAEKGAELGRIAAHNGPVNKLAITANDTRLVSASADHTLRVHDLPNRKLVTTLRGHAQGVGSIAVTSDCEKIASGSYDGTVKLWSPSISEDSRLLLRGSNYVAMAARFFPDGRRIVGGSADRSLRIWDARTGEKLNEKVDPGISTLRVEMFPNGDRFATCGSRTVQLWDAATLETIFSHENPQNSESMAVNGHGTRIAHACGVEVLVRDAATGDVVRTLGRFNGPPSCMAFNRPGDLLAISCSGGAVHLCEIETGRIRWTVTRSGHNAAIVFSNDDQGILLGTQSGQLILLDSMSGEERKVFSGGHTASVTALDFSPDGKRVVSGGHDQTIKLWDPLTGSETLTLHGHSRPVMSVEFSPEGNRILSTGQDGATIVWHKTPP